MIFGRRRRAPLDGAFARGVEAELHFATRPLPGGDRITHRGAAIYLGDWKDDQRRRMHCFETRHDPPPQRVYLYPDEVVRFDA